MRSTAVAWDRVCAQLCSDGVPRQKAMWDYERSTCASLRPQWSFINWIRSHESGYGQPHYLNGPIEHFARNFVRRLLSAATLAQRSLFICKFSASIPTGPKAHGGRSPTTSLLPCGNFTLREGYNIRRTGFETETPFTNGYPERTILSIRETTRLSCGLSCRVLRARFISFFSCVLRLLML